MASITIQLTEQCSGGGHYTLTIGGEFAHTFVIDGINEIRDMNADDLRTFVLGCINLGKRGRTLAQVRNALLAGVTVTI